jgi:hypothetical protein
MNKLIKETLKKEEEAFTILLINKIRKFIFNNAIRKVKYIRIYRYLNKKLLSIFIIYSRTQSVKEKISTSFLTSILFWRFYNVSAKLFIPNGQHEFKYIPNQSCNKSGEWIDLKILGAKLNDKILLTSNGNDPLLILCL